MKKVKIEVPKDEWGSLNTKYPVDSDRVGDNEFTAGTHNVDTSVKGVLTKRLGGVDYASLGGAAKDQYEAIFSDGVRHLLTVVNGTLKYSSGDGQVHDVVSGLTATVNNEFATTQDRVYFGNGVQKKVYDRVTSYGGVSYLPATITIVDYTLLSTDSITIGTTTKTEGTHWTAGTDNPTTAESLKTALNTISGVTATRNGSVITVVATSTLSISSSDVVNMPFSTISSGRIKDFGAIAPTTAPSVAVAAGGSVPIGIHTYKVTFVYYDSEESNGGLASAGATTTSGNQTVNLTSIPIGGYGVTTRKIYRDNNDGLYYLVGIILNNTATTFSDTLNAPTTTIPEDNSIPPDFTLINLFLDRLFLAGVPGDPYFIFYSEPGLPDIFPSSNYIPCNQEDPITGMVVYLDRLIVFNRRSMGQLLGRTSDQFRYAQIEGSVGCVDNRSIQIRVLNGVPVLIWLSDKGFYAYNGNSVVYISDKIEDQVNFNIQQSVIQKNKITHSDYTIFTQGSWSDGSNPYTSDQTKGGINLNSSPGQITTKGPYWDTIAHPGASYEEQTNPKKVWDTQAEWENGTTKQNLNTKDGSNSLKKLVTLFSQASEGTTAGTVIDGSNIKLQTTTSFTGESNISTPYTQYEFSTYHPDKVAIPIIPQRSGVINKIRIRDYQVFSAPANPIGTVQIESDLGGSPSGSVISGGSGTISLLADGSFKDSSSLSASLSGGIKYWIVINAPPGYYFSRINKKPALSGGRCKFKIGSNPWQLSVGHAAGDYPNYVDFDFMIQYFFTYTPVSKSGSWISPIYDTYSDSIYGTIYGGGGGTTILPSGTASQVIVEASDSAVFSPYTTVNTSYLISPLFTFNFSSINKRYWRLKLLLNTTDDTVTPVFGPPYIYFGSSLWESEVIDTTTDSNLYTALTEIINVPPGTAYTLKIATADADTGPWSFVSFGSHVVKRYVKIQVIFTATDNTKTPTLSSLDFKWRLQSTFISKSIDTGTTPSGWDIFQTSYTPNGGTVTYSMRSATTEIGLSSATWYTVTSGEFPTSSLPVNQWVQWRVVITTNPDQVPTIDSTTINWFIGSATQNIRCASLFYNTNYYLAAAEFGNTTNNLLFIFDQEGKWRVYRNINAATMSYFFNSPYFCDALTEKIVKFLQGNSDSGSSIPFEFRSKAFDFSADENFDDKVKILEKCIISGRNTGATYIIEYSTDDGETFYPLKDKDGNSSFTTSEDGKGFYKWLRPDYTQSIPSGYSVMLRIYNNDTKEVEIDGFKLTAFVRKHDPIE